MMRVWWLVKHLVMMMMIVGSASELLSEEERLGKILGTTPAGGSRPLKSEELWGGGDPSEPVDDLLERKYVRPIMDQMEVVVRQRLEKLMEGTTSSACRGLVGSRFTETYARLLKEEWLPFEAEQFRSECDAKAPELSLPKVPKDKIRLAYLLLVHENPKQVKRLVEALREEPERHSFVIHVDGKKESHETYDELEAYYAKDPRVEMSRSRANVTWGGFNVVKATLLGLDVVLQKFDGDFDWIVTMSGYTYPLATNEKIRETLASFPADAEFLEIRPKPNEPQSRAWHQYVECDNQMRRIFRLAPAKGINMYMGSQWMIVTRDFVRYVVGDAHRALERRRSVDDVDNYLLELAHHTSDFKAEKQFQSFSHQYERYAQFVMVSDENFFVTVMKNSPFCKKHHNDNFLHVQFDQWENEKASGPAQNKCLQPNPRHCGRSPTTLTLDYLPVLELGGALFARKFDPNFAVDVIDALDTKRQRETASNFEAPEPPVYQNVRVVYGGGDEQLCAQVSELPGLSRLQREVTLEPCSDDNDAQRFDLGPCSTDGHIDLQKNKPANVTPGLFAPAPFCPIHAAYVNSTLKGHGLCLDLEREQIVPDTNIIAYACSGRWNQLFGFGTNVHNGKPNPGAVYVNIPYAHHDPKELCIQATVVGENDDNKKFSLQVQKCDAENRHQIFHLEYAAAPQEASDASSSPIDDTATTTSEL